MYKFIVKFILINIYIYTIYINIQIHALGALGKIFILSNLGVL